MTWPALAIGLWLLAWLFAGIMTAAGWAVLRGHREALVVMVGAALAAVVLACAGAVLW